MTSEELDFALEDLKDIIGESIFIYADNSGTLVSVEHDVDGVQIREVCVTTITFDDSKVYLNYMDEDGFLLRVDYEDHGKTYMFTREMAEYNLKNQILGIYRW